MKRSRWRVLEGLARADRPERWSGPDAANAGARGRELARAIERNELLLRYQPIVDLRSGECRRVEALLRWRTPHGSVPPAEVVAIAVATGQTAALSRSVIGAAARQWAAWRECGLGLGIAVNVAGPELADADLIDWVIDTFRALGIEPNTFTFDLRASDLPSVPGIGGTLRRLAAAGARLALDGVSLADVPARSFAWELHELKLSRALVRRLTTEAEAVNEARALIEVARDFGSSVVAVGVEDPATRDLVARIGCELAQGHWLSRPLAARRVAPWQRAAVGLAFGGALALTAYMGAGKAAASKGGASHAQAAVGGFFPALCWLDLPTGVQAPRAADRQETARERAGSEFVQQPARAEVLVESSISAAVREHVAQAVDRDFAQLERAFGRAFVKRPAVYVFATRSSFALGLQRIFGVRATDAGMLAAANGGVTLPRGQAIAINLQNVPSDADLAIVRHELTHAIVHEIVGPQSTLPAWLDEGLATLEERALRVNDDGIRDAAITLTLLAAGDVSLTDLDSARGWAQRNAALGGDAYTVAGEAARLVTARVTQAGVLRMLDETAKLASFGAAYAEVAGESLADFERAFPARLASEQGAPRITQRPLSSDLMWTVAGFAPQTSVKITILGAGYRLDYSITTDRYGMFSGTFGSTARPGEYSLEARGQGGRAITSLHVGAKSAT